MGRLGFTDQRAQYIAEKIRADSMHDNHITILDFAHIFIENLFKYDLLLTDELSSLPDRNQGFNFPYNHQAPNRTIQCRNFERSDDLEKVLEEFFDPKTERTDNSEVNEEINYSRWYHGTDSVACSLIVKDGINLNKSSRANDFSFRKGFYMSDNSTAALNWVSKRRFSEVEWTAILQFKIVGYETLKDYKGTEDEERGLRLDEEKDLEFWKKIVRYNRSEESSDEGDFYTVYSTHLVCFKCDKLESDQSFLIINNCHKNI